MTPDNPLRPQPLKRLDEQPVFDELWQAQVLAMVDALITRGDVAPTNWSEDFGAGLKHAHESGAPDDLNTYYAVALETLEKLVIGHCNVTGSEISTRHEDWKQSYLNTPHGQPVILKGR